MVSPATSPALEVGDLTFTYPRRPAPALEGVGFAARAGELVFVLGPNGSGKSTLFRLLLGLLRPERGTVAIAGRDAAGLSVRERAREVAYVAQEEGAAFDFRVRDVALMGRTPHLSALGQRTSPADEALVDQALESLGIAHLAEVGVRGLSGGERQLVMLARALVQQGRLLVLDEPTSALDFANQTRVLAQLQRLADSGLTLLVSSHNPVHALSHADRILLLKGGRLVRDTTPERITEDDLSDLYGTPMRLLTAREVPGLRMCVAGDLISARPRSER